MPHSVRISTEHVSKDICFQRSINHVGKSKEHESLFLSNIDPSSVRHQPRKHRCVFSCKKMRLAFISTLSLHVTPANRGEIVVFSYVKCAWASFRIKIYMSLPPTPGEIVVFFTEKSALYQPPRPCVFSSKTRLACNVPVNRVHFHCGCLRYTLRLGFTSQCGFTCDAASPFRMPFSFSNGKSASREIAGKFHKAGTKANVDQGVSKGDVGSCDSHLTKRMSLF